MHYSGTFRSYFDETIVIFEISTREFVKIPIFMLNKKKLNMEPKLPYLGDLGQHFETTTVIFEISTIEFDKMQSFM